MTVEYDDKTKVLTIRADSAEERYANVSPVAYGWLCEAVSKETYLAKYIRPVYKRCE